MKKRNITDFAIEDNTFDVKSNAMDFKLILNLGYLTHETFFIKKEDLIRLGKVIVRMYPEVKA